MGLKLTVGFQRKVGLPEYGSKGATCQVEIEIDPSLIERNPSGFQGKVAETFQACQRAVEHQLAAGDGTLPEISSHENSPLPAVDRNGSSSGNGHVSNGYSGNGHAGEGHAGNGRPVNGHSTNGHSGGGYTGNGHSGNGHTGNGRKTAGQNGYSRRGESGTVTQSQVRAIYAISRRNGVNPAELARERFHVNRLEELTVREASSLIDELKSEQSEVQS